jgi:hypothetical protein
MDNERKIDFLKVRKMIGKCTPEQMGKLMREYFNKYQSPVLVSDLGVSEFTADLDSFNAPLFGSKR